MGTNFSVPDEIIFEILEYLDNDDYLRFVKEWKVYVRQRDCFMRFQRSITNKEREYVEFDWFTLLSTHRITKRPCSVCQQYFLKMTDIGWNPKCNNLECSQYASSGSFGNKSVTNSYYEYGWF